MIKFSTLISYQLSIQTIVPVSASQRAGSPQSLSLNPRICSSHLLRLANPCCNACFTILFLNIFINMPSSKNRSNCAFRLRLAAPHYDVNCKTWVNKLKGSDNPKNHVINFYTVPFYYTDCHYLPVIAPIVHNSDNTVNLHNRYACFSKGIIDLKQTYVKKCYTI